MPKPIQLFKFLNLRWMFSVSLWLLLAPGVSNAANSAINNFPVTVVVPYISRITIPPLEFANYDPVSIHADKDYDVEVKISISYTQGTTVNITFSKNSQTETRELVNGNYRLKYQLYSDPLRTHVLDEDNPLKPRSNDEQSVDTDRGLYKLTVYARLFKGQEAANVLGKFTDDVFIKIAY